MGTDMGAAAGGRDGASPSGSTGKHRTNRLELQYESPIPLYYQLREALVSKICREGMSVGDQIPTEAEIEAEYGVSRTTVRQALSALVSEGIITRRRGKGSVLVRPPVREHLPNLVGLTEEMKAQRRQVHSDVLECRWVTPSPTVCRALRVAKPDHALLVVRLRYIDGEPVFYTKDCLPAWLGLTPCDDFSGSLFDMLRSKCGVRVDKADTTISAVAAGEPEMRYLQASEGFPLLSSIRKFYDTDDRPVGYLEELCRSDRYHYYVQQRA